MNLIQISRGEWLDPGIITAIVAVAPNTWHGARVLVQAGTESVVIPCVTHAKATHVADELADKVNSARRYEDGCNATVGPPRP